jgi:hypothetical protein
MIHPSMTQRFRSAFPFGWHARECDILESFYMHSARNRYNQGKKVAGMIYLHDISEGRFEISKNALNVMKQYFGDGAAGKVVLATTKWDDVKPEVAERREKQLSREYWKEMLDKGSQMARFLHTPKSAWEIVDLIIQPDPIGTISPNPLPNPFSPLSAFTTVGFVTAVVSFPMIYYVFGS